jgi:fluoride exporter
VIVLGVALAGALGAVLRFAVDHTVQRHARSDFPLGTLVVNTTGSFVVGLLVGLADRHGLSSTWVTVVGTGLIGAYTTFSTFTFDTVRLLENGEWGQTTTNVVASLVTGLAAAALGLALATVI